MKLLIGISLMFLMWSAMAQTKGVVPTNFSQSAISEHFMLFWNDGQTSNEEVDQLKVQFEAVYKKTSELVGAEHMPAKKLIITLRGEGYDPKTQKKSVPHVDWQGRIHLYRYTSSGYMGAFAHELVHAIRVGTLPRWNGFFEEGLASGLAHYLYPEGNKFPRYGYPLDVVAGYWLVSGRGIPLETLRLQHRRLNLKCQIQSYVIREDFYYYLINTYGVDKLLAYAYSQQVGTTEGYTTHFGKTFQFLVQDWEVDLTQRYQKFEGAEAMAEEYLTQSIAQYMPVCELGKDY